MNIAEKWKDAVQAVRIRRRDHTFFVPQGLLTDDFAEQLFQFDQLLMQGKLYKNSKTSTAALVNPALFLKRTNNKGLSFTLRYLFRPARVFRAAYAAERFREIGIPTPEILAVGESRRGLILDKGYIAQRAYPGMFSMAEKIQASSDPVTDIRNFFAEAGRMARHLHENSLVHGDLKLSNFYFVDGVYGILDLDSVCFHSGTESVFADELAHIVASAHIDIERNPAMTKMQNLTDFLIDILLESYGRDLNANLIAEQSAFLYRRMMQRLLSHDAGK